MKEKSVVIEYIILRLIFYKYRILLLLFVNYYYDKISRGMKNEGFVWNQIKLVKIIGTEEWT